MIKKLFLFILISFPLLINGCGFHLRGSIAFDIERVFIRSEAANTIAQEIQRRLTAGGVKITEKAKNAQIIVTLSDETIDRRMLSVSAVSGKLEEVELNYRVDIVVHDKKSKVLLHKQTLSLVRDYSFDETAVLAMGEEEIELRNELFKDMSAQIIRMLRAIKIEQSKENLEAAQTETSSSDSKTEDVKQEKSVEKPLKVEK